MCGAHVWSVFLLAVCATSVLCGSGRRLGRYFQRQPQELLPDGSYPETVTRFQLILKTQGSHVIGTFTNLDEALPKAQPIQNGKRIDGRFCFDIFISGEDCRWCIRAHGSDLEGTWNGGPEGGPAAGGLGAGARLFGGARQEAEVGTPPSVMGR